MTRTTLGPMAVALALTLSFSPGARAQSAGSGSSRAGSGSSQPADSGSSRRAASWTGAEAGVRSASAAPSARATGMLQEATRHIQRQQALSGGYLFLRDAQKRQVLALVHQKAHQHVARIEAGRAREILSRVPGGNPALLPSDAREVVFACHDFQEARSKKTVDVDVWMVERSGGPAVPVQYLIHGVDGAKRFAYAPGETTPIE